MKKLPLLPLDHFFLWSVPTRLYHFGAIRSERTMPDRKVRVPRIRKHVVPHILLPCDQVVVVGQFVDERLARVGEQADGRRIAHQKAARKHPQRRVSQRFHGHGGWLFESRYAKLVFKGHRSSLGQMRPEGLECGFGLWNDGVHQSVVHPCRASVVRSPVQGEHEARHFGIRNGKIFVCVLVRIAMDRRSARIDLWEKVAQKIVQLTKHDRNVLELGAVLPAAVIVGKHHPNHGISNRHYKPGEQSIGGCIFFVIKSLL